MATIDDERGHVQGVAQQRGATFADFAAPLDRVAGVMEARIKARVGYVLLGSGEIADGVGFGVDRGDQRAVEAQGEQGRVELSRALVELFFDVGDLLSHRGQVIEDRAELRFGQVFGLAGADRLLGRGEELVDGLGSDPPPARAAEKRADLIGVLQQLCRGQPDLPSNKGDILLFLLLERPKGEKSGVWPERRQHRWTAFVTVCSIGAMEGRRSSITRRMTSPFSI